MKSNKQLIRESIRKILKESDNLLYINNNVNTANENLKGASLTLFEITKGKVLFEDVNINEDLTKMYANITVNGDKCKLKCCGNSIFEITELGMSGTTHQLAKAINGNSTIATACLEHFNFRNSK